MGNKTPAVQNQNPLSRQISRSKLSDQPDNSHSIFNCMALQTCCVRDELLGLEIDNTRIHGGITEEQLQRKNSQRQTGYTPKIIQITQGTENCLSEYDSQFSSRLYQQRKSSQPTLLNKNFSGQKVNQKNAIDQMQKMIDSKSQAMFNNRNNTVMTGMFSGNIGTITSGEGTQIKNPLYYAVNEELKVRKNQTIDTARSGQHVYNTLMDTSPKRGKCQSVKMALTNSVDASVGDTSTPEQNKQNHSRRDCSPIVREFLQELINLEEDLEEIDVVSTRSARLYQPNQIKEAKEKRVSQHMRRHNLFPELSSLKPAHKESSKTKKEFKKATQVVKRHVLNQLDKLKVSTKQNLLEHDLPVDVKKFIDDSKGRYPTLSLQNGAVYVGGRINHKFEGTGLYLAADKSYYFGMWKDGKRNGDGTYCLANGIMYRGRWVQDQMNGFGICKNSDGTFYEGEWLNQQAHGKGYKTFQDKSSYKGEFKYGAKSGYGQLFCPDGGIFKGQFSENQINGKGVYTWPDGIQYDGMWSGNKKDGKGVLKWIDGSRQYSGDFKDDERHGQGTYTWDNGTKSYRGFWRSGLKDGIGFVRDEFDFVERKGLWFCGKLIKWMPKDSEDEGQDGESVKSADKRDWESQQTHVNKQSPTLKLYDSQKKLGKQQEAEQNDPYQIRNNLLNPPLINQQATERQPSDLKKSQGGVSNNRSSGKVTPTFRKATEDVKRLNIRRKPITKRVREDELPKATQPSSQVASQKFGMLPPNKRVMLVSRDLLEFNPPEVFEEMQKMMGCNDLPSPKFENKAIELIEGDEEDELAEIEYFQFSPEFNPEEEESF